ncbi:MAG: class I SAM-dependent methyltransferase [Proteobacteria bacterium]|nr:class I SAM-dependent methyltransferase [Pseudomonadota bacterium]
MKKVLTALSVVLLCISCGSRNSGNSHHPQQAPPQKEHTKGDNKHREMAHDFSDPEHWRQVFDDPERDVRQMPDHVVEIMKIAPGMTVADLGAGTGYFLPYLSKAVGENGMVLGLDVEQSLVDYMNERAKNEGLSNVEARVVEADNPALEPQSVDRILIVNTWHHLPDRVAYAKKLATALSRAGALFIVDVTIESEKGPPKRHRVTPAQLIETLEKAGFTAKIARENLPDQYIVSAKITQ